MNDEEKRILEDYHQQVKWIRDHVPPDEIYEFYQQLLLSAEYILASFLNHADVDALNEKDIVLKERTHFIMDIHFLKQSGFNGMLITGISVRKR